MSKKIILAGLMVLSTMTAYAATDALREGLRIHLLREITIEGKTPTLGEVAILRGGESLTAKAGSVPLGHLSVPDQDLVISRKVVLSRLACSGINTSDVTMTGAEEITIKRQHQSITGSEFAAAATEFLKKNMPDKTICDFTPVRLPNNLVAPGSGDAIRLTCKMVSLRGNQCKVRTTAFCDDQEIGTADTVFLCKYQCRKAVAKVNIARGQQLSADNITIVAGISNAPEPAHWTAPYGQIAKRAFAANAAIEPHMIATATPQILLKRNQTVTIRIARPGFVASATGKALQDGAAGQYIKVKNVDSQKIIMAKIIDNGTVEPIF